MIELVHLNKSYDSKPVLRDVNMTIERGKITVIIGRSGCGKSVLLKLILGLIKPDKGQVFVEGQEITTMGQEEIYKIRRKFGMLFQNAALFDSMTVEENMALPLIEHSDLPYDVIKKRVQEKLSMVGMPEVKDLKPAELSGGMRKRVGLARALMMEPEIVLYDEPTTGLDPIMADVINNIVIGFNENLGITSIVVTHDMGSVYKIADRVAMIQRGIVLFDGTPDALKKTKDPVVRQFIEGKAEGPIKINREIIYTRKEQEEKLL
ncbi:putative phospholipid import ATP-binding protein MlaF [bacterium BMS3Abin05]|nr:putative phospholipid import ATP-binding protein MlaF [bacterium BMS3Abin05]GBE26272.1 putative phospholipid import ATP-binding protein MlaF [bacterium BMS3Bbin03]HDZ12638.1 ABC transporter ATP-binding protein [Bacteroidota bacterium]